MRATHPNAAERHLHLPVEPCELPDGIHLVYADDRGRRHAIALEDAAAVDFGRARVVRQPPAYRGQRNFPGWWWSATTQRHLQRLRQAYREEGRSVSPTNAGYGR